VIPSVASAPMTFVSRGLSGGGVYGSVVGELWAQVTLPSVRRWPSSGPQGTLPL
jgi:hypothetical protein